MGLRLLAGLLVAGLSLAAAAAFVAPWSPNSRTVPTTYAGESEYFAELDAALWTFLLAWGARHPDRPYSPPILVPLADPATANDPRLFEQWWASPIFRAHDPVVAWGLTLLVALTATAVSAAWAGRRFTGSAWGGAAFAAFFAFGTFRAGHVVHVEAMAAPFLPLVAWALWRLGRSGAGENGSGLSDGLSGSALAAGAVFGLAAVDYSYSAFALAVALPPAIAWLVMTRRAMWQDVAAAAAVAAGLVLVFYGPIALRYAEFHALTRLERPLAEIDAGSAGLRAWFTGPAGTLVSPFGGTGEFLPDLRLFPGWALLVAAILGFGSARRMAPAVLVCGGVAFVASLGTWRPLLADLGFPPIPVSTPWEWAYEALLPVRAIRAPARLAVVAHLAIAAVAAFGIARLGQGPLRHRILAVVLVVAGFLEARHGMHEVTIRAAHVDDPAYAWLADQPEGGAVLELPMGFNGDYPKRDRDEIASLLTSLKHGKPTPNGTMAMVIPWHDAIAVHLRRPRPGVTRALVEALGVRWIVARDETSARAAVSLGFETASAFPTGTRVYRVDSALSVPRSPAELQERMAAWMPRTPSWNGEGWGARLEMPRVVAVELGAPLRLRGVAWNTGRETWTVHGAIYGLGPVGDLQVASRDWDGLDGSGEPRDLRGRSWRLSGRILADAVPGESAPIAFTGFAPRTPGLWRVTFGLAARGIGPLGEPGGTMELEVR